VTKPAYRSTLLKRSQPIPCDRWVLAPLTDSLAGSEGTIDDYVCPIPVGPGQDAAATFAQLEDRLWRYDIFPPELVEARVCSDDGRLHEGTTIIQRVALGPLTVESAVRVVRAWRDRGPNGEAAGFSYATLEGHPERGVSTFVLRRDQQDQLTFAIHARSRPGSVLTRLGRPVARWFQRPITRAALEHFTTDAAYRYTARPSG
jgi:uncharacterized protein (UPF0548 family)